MKRRFQKPSKIILKTKEHGREKTGERRGGQGRRRASVKGWRNWKRAKGEKKREMSHELREQKRARKEEATGQMSTFLTHSTL